jgi:hypothetical protein
MEVGSYDKEMEISAMEPSAMEISAMELPAMELPVLPSMIESALSSMMGSRVLLVPVAELLPVMDPRHNLREIAKQMLLLEDHLGQPRKRCDDCIRKHFAFIEALAEEGCSLQPKGEFYLLFKDLQEMARRLYAELYRKLITHEDVAENLRMIRKPLLKLTMPWLAEEKYREV